MCTKYLYLYTKYHENDNFFTFGTKYASCPANHTHAGNYSVKKM